MEVAVSVFRELFVEVPIALLEAAVHKAQAPKEPTPAACLELTSLDSMCFMAQHYQGYARPSWTLAEVSRRADRRQTFVTVRLECKHTGWFTIDESELFSVSGASFVDYVLGVLDGMPKRRCYCVQKEAA